MIGSLSPTIYVKRRPCRPLKASGSQLVWWMGVDYSLHQKKVYTCSIAKYSKLKETRGVLFSHKKRLKAIPLTLKGAKMVLLGEPKNGGHFQLKTAHDPFQ